jgi:hypothetical protein
VCLFFKFLFGGGRREGAPTLSFFAKNGRIKELFYASAGVVKLAGMTAEIIEHWQTLRGLV